MQVVFFEVSSSLEKKECLGLVAAHSFLHCTRLLFTVDGEVEARYLSQLLWSYPPEAFLPHDVTLRSSQEPLAITWSCSSNVNGAQLLFNLSKEKAAAAAPCKLVAEFWDLASEERRERAELHWSDYSAQGWHAERYPWDRSQFEKILHL